MSDPGFGPPVDALDTVCKQYKDCQKCARAKFGETCIGEFRKYRYGLLDGNRGKGVQCKNNPSKSDDDACERALCECDAQFAEAHQKVTGVFQNKYHSFWSSMEPEGAWDPKTDSSICVPNGVGPIDLKCCGNPDGPQTIYNDFKLDCCVDGTVKPNGKCGKTKDGYWF